MKNKSQEKSMLRGGFFGNINLGMKSKLIIIFLVVKIVPIILLTVIAFQQVSVLGDELRTIAVNDSSAALNASAVANIERMTTDTAKDVADFLYSVDSDILYVSKLYNSNADVMKENFSTFINNKYRRMIKTGDWKVAEDGKSWVPANRTDVEHTGGESTNKENNDLDGFNYRDPDVIEYDDEAAQYDEITFFDVDGEELVKVVADNSRKKNYKMDATLKDVSVKTNTYIKAETYYPEVKKLGVGKIYVSDVIGAYVGTNYIGMYVPDTVNKAMEGREHKTEYDPERQAYSGMENPVGERFEGIVRWATPVSSGGSVVGYVTLALNHDHIMEFVDHQTPMDERFTELPDAYAGNYAFIWDYKCRSICHPRHHSIVGYDPATGEEQIPWLETSIYDDFMATKPANWQLPDMWDQPLSGNLSVMWDFMKDVPTFNNQSRKNKPKIDLTERGYVGLDGRYLNNAPQCTGWMDLTEHGGSGSFYILWSDLYKLTTAASIPYYTGQYAPEVANNQRGFGIVTIGAGLDDFTRPAKETGITLTTAIEKSSGGTLVTLSVTALIILAAVVLIVIFISNSLSGIMVSLVEGMSRFRSGERQFRFRPSRKDEFGELAESFDEMAQSIEDSVKNALCITDMDKKVRYMNPEGLRLRNMTLDEIIGTSYDDNCVYPPGSKYCPITALNEGFDTEIYYHENMGRYIRATANYLIDKDGEKKGYIIETADVTDMVKKQKVMQEQKELLDGIFSASPDLIWYVNANGEYLTVNPRFASIINKEAAEFTGKTAKEMLPKEIANEFIKHDTEALTAKKPIYAEDIVTFADGHQETLEAVRTPILDEEGEIAGLLGFARNVTQRVRIESDLRQMQIDLEKAVEAANIANDHKGEFLARMSHEIRTPMNAVIGITGIVLKKLDDINDEAVTEIKPHVKQIESSSQHLLGLLNDILDISKIEAGKIELVDEIVDLPKLITTVAGIIRPRCTEKNITFNVVSDKFPQPAYICDSLRLRQVLINLLGNSVKFTPECGVVTFSANVIEDKKEKTLIRFSVKDTGIGISKSAQETIFQPFEQGDRKIPNKYGGTGLGLAISRSIVNLFGGEIAVTSEPGEGSEFFFEIWLTKTDSEVIDEASVSDATGKFAGKRILLVDDVEVNRMIIKAMLEDTGAIIDEADDGIKAVDAFRYSQSKHYDLILMDIKMPNMDGYEASSAIRALDHPDAKTVPIVALTANAFKDDIANALAHGMNAHISKPVELNILLEMLVKYLLPVS